MGKDEDSFGAKLRLRNRGRRHIEVSSIYSGMDAGIVFLADLDSPIKQKAPIAAQKIARSRRQKANANPWFAVRWTS